MNLTPHFTLEEFEASQIATRHGIDNRVPEHLLPNIERTARMMEQVRDILGKPIHVTSGYRCEAVEMILSKKVYGMHVRALACDFVCPAYGTPLEVARKLETDLIGFDQLIYEGNWIHLGLATAAPRHEVLTAKFYGGKAFYQKGLIP